MKSPPEIGTIGLYTWYSGKQTKVVICPSEKPHLPHTWCELLEPYPPHYVAGEKMPCFYRYFEPYDNP